MLLPVPHQWRKRRRKRSPHPRARWQKFVLGAPAILLALALQAWFVYELMRASELPPPPPLEPEFEFLLALPPEPLPPEPEPTPPETASQAAAPGGAGGASAGTPARTASASAPPRSAPSPPAAAPAQPSAAPAPPATAPPAPAAVPRLVLQQQVSPPTAAQPPPVRRPTPAAPPTPTQAAPLRSVLAAEAPRPQRLDPPQVSLPDSSAPPEPAPSAVPQTVLAASAPEVAQIERADQIYDPPAPPQPPVPAAPAAPVPPTLAVLRPQAAPVPVQVLPAVPPDTPAPAPTPPSARPNAPTTGLLATERVERPQPLPLPEVRTRRDLGSAAPPQPVAATTGLLSPSRRELPLAQTPPEIARERAALETPVAPVLATNRGVLSPQTERPTAPELLPPTPLARPEAPATLRLAPVSSTRVVEVEAREIPRSAPVPTSAPLARETAPALAVAPVAANQGLLSVAPRDPAALADPALQRALAQGLRERRRLAPPAPVLDATDIEQPGSAPVDPAAATAPKASDSADPLADDGGFGPARSGPASASDLLAGVADVARDQVAATRPGPGAGSGDPFGRNSGADPYFGELPNRLAGLRRSQPGRFREVLDFLTSTLAGGGMTYRDQQWVDGAEINQLPDADAIEDGMSVLLQRWIDKHHGSLRRACTDNHALMSPAVQRLLCDESAQLELLEQSRKGQ